MKRNSNTTGQPFTVQQGDTFPIVLTYKHGDANGFPVGKDVTMGLYQPYTGRLIASASTVDGTLQRDGETLVMQITHEASLSAVGEVELEITLHGDGLIDHADKVVRINFEKRNNNRLL